MNGKMSRGFVFDLDGTLVDSLSGIAQGVTNACRSIGYDTVIPREDVHKMVGKGAWNLCQRSLEYLGVEPTRERISALELAFVREYAQTWQSQTVIYPGLESLLRELAGNGARLAVLTNKPDKVAVPLVKAVFRDVVDFSFIIGSSDRFPRKPEPDSLLYIMEQWGLDKERMILVGDSRTDCETAWNAGIRSVMVGWGYEDEPVQTAERYSALLVHESSQLREVLV